MNYGNVDTLRKVQIEGFKLYDHDDMDENGKDALIETQEQLISKLDRKIEELKTENRLLTDRVEAGLRRIEFLKARR